MTFEKPKMLDTASEGARAFFDYFEYLIKNRQERRESMEKRVILVIPGFLFSDPMTTIFRNKLSEIGHYTYGWRNGTNIGVREKDIQVQMDLIKELYEKHNKKVTLIGYSLGGVYAKELAFLCKDMVDEVITMGSPINDYSGSCSSITTLYQFLNKPLDHDALEELEKAFFSNVRNFDDIKITSIYSKSDGIVQWQASHIENESENSRNIEVGGAHLGLLVNVNAMKAVISVLEREKTNI